MWAFTGGCHYSDTCTLYTSKCGKCPILNSICDNDISTWVFNRKMKSFSLKKDIVIVCPSRWMYQCSTKSALMSRFPHFIIPNTIDVELFRPMDKIKAREILQLPPDKKIVLFGGLSALSDPRKGFHFLMRALSNITYENVVIAVFGTRELKETTLGRFKLMNLGHITNDEKLVVAYNSADMVVVPSTQENLSNVIMESLSCGVPVVAFNIGGNPDMIEHTKNGYLATPYDTVELTRGID
jgi:glycosyltransferase involved in cell wall biosynthesis